MINNNDMESIRCQFSDVPALKKVCQKFDFPPEYFAVFTQLHCCGPEHFRNPGLPANIIGKVLESLDQTEHPALVNSILAVQHDGVRNTLIAMCSEELIAQVYSPEEFELLENLINQIDNLSFLYGKTGFREHMIALYDYFVKPFLSDFKTEDHDSTSDSIGEKVRKPLQEKKQERELPGEE